MRSSFDSEANREVLGSMDSEHGFDNRTVVACSKKLNLSIPPPPNFHLQNIFPGIDHQSGAKQVLHREKKHSDGIFETRRRRKEH